MRRAVRSTPAPPHLEAAGRERHRRGPVRRPRRGLRCRPGPGPRRCTDERAAIRAPAASKDTSLGQYALEVRSTTTLLSARSTRKIPPGAFPSMLPKSAMYTCPSGPHRKPERVTQIGGSQAQVSGRGESHPPALAESGVRVPPHRAPTGRLSGARQQMPVGEELWLALACSLQLLPSPFPHLGRRISRRSWAYLAWEGVGGGRDPQQAEDLQLESVELGFEDLESSACRVAQHVA